VSSIDQLPSRTEEYAGAWWHRVESDELGLPVFVRLATTTSGRLAIVGVMVGESDGSIEVTSSDLHSLALREILETIGRSTNRNGGDELAEFVRSGIRETADDLPEAAERIQGKRVWTDDQYRGLAALFHRAKAQAPGRHIKAIRDLWPKPVSEATIHRRLAEAERRGFLSRSDEIEAAT
jgi:hypothetical protein